MSDPGDTKLNLLLFSVSGVHFGVDAEQVAEIADYDGENSEDLFWFHEELEYGAMAVRYASPTTISIRTGDEHSYRVIIDSMEDIAEFSLNGFHLFPALLKPFVVRKGLWGILTRNGKMVLLVDFQLLLKQKYSVTN
jgi:chemotaxis signal transduction protein